MDPSLDPDQLLETNFFSNIRHHPSDQAPISILRGELELLDNNKLLLLDSLLGLNIVRYFFVGTVKPLHELEINVAGSICNDKLYFGEIKSNYDKKEGIAHEQILTRAKMLDGIFNICLERDIQIIGTIYAYASNGKRKEKTLFNEGDITIMLKYV